MKIREIILDFTSLLDIVMIILFFFVLFSTFEVEDVIAQAEQTTASYEELTEQHEQEYEKQQAEMQAEWDKLLSAEKNAALNQQALMDYNNGCLVAFKLQDIESSNSWTVKVTSGDTMLGELTAASGDMLTDEVFSLLDKAGLLDGGVVIAALTYDGNAYGTANAVPRIREAVYELQKQYEGIYFTSINISK